MLRNTALAGFGLSLFGIETKAAASDENILSNLLAGPAPAGNTMIGVPFETPRNGPRRHDRHRFAGQSILGEFVNIPNVRITAVCDVLREKTDKAKAIVEKAGQPSPAVYVNGDRGYEELLERDDIDIVDIATPWKWHVPQCSMR